MGILRTQQLGREPVFARSGQGICNIGMLQNRWTCPPPASCAPRMTTILLNMEVSIYTVEGLESNCYLTGRSKECGFQGSSCSQARGCVAVRGGRPLSVAKRASTSTKPPSVGLRKHRTRRLGSTAKVHAEVVQNLIVHQAQTESQEGGLKCLLGC